MKENSKFKTVGRQVDSAELANLVQDARILQETVNRLHNNALIPRRVYRFHTFAESHQWMLQTIAATHAHLKSKTS